MLSRKQKDDMKVYYKKIKKYPSRRFGQYKSGAKTRNIPFLLSFEDFMTFWQKPCSYCGSEVETIGLDRLSSDLPYSLETVVPCCSTCNYMKHNMGSKDFISQCEKIIRYSKGV